MVKTFCAHSFWQKKKPSPLDYKDFRSLKRFIKAYHIKWKLTKTFGGTLAGLADVRATMIAENAVKRVTDLEELMLKSDEHWFFWSVISREQVPRLTHTDLIEVYNYNRNSFLKCLAMEVYECNHPTTSGKHKIIFLLLYLVTKLAPRPKTNDMSNCTERKWKVALMMEGNPTSFEFIQTTQFSFGT